MPLCQTCGVELITEVLTPCPQCHQDQDCGDADCWLCGGAGQAGVNICQCPEGPEAGKLIAELTRDRDDVVAMLRELEREAYIRGVSERARLILDRFPTQRTGEGSKP